MQQRGQFLPHHQDPKQKHSLNLGRVGKKCRRTHRVWKLVGPPQLLTSELLCVSGKGTKSSGAALREAQGAQRRRECALIMVLPGTLVVRQDMVESRRRLEAGSGTLTDPRFPQCLLKYCHAKGSSEYQRYHVEPAGTPGRRGSRWMCSPSLHILKREVLEPGHSGYNVGAIL